MDIEFRNIVRTPLCIRSINKERVLFLLGRLAHDTNAGEEPHSVLWRMKRMDAKSFVIQRRRLVTIGLLLGAFVAILLRPTAILGVQLPVQHMVTRGIFLEGLDEVFIGIARRSFNQLIVGMILGGLAGGGFSIYLRQNSMLLLKSAGSSESNEKDSEQSELLAQIGHWWHKNIDSRFFPFVDAMYAKAAEKRKLDSSDRK